MTDTSTVKKTASNVPESTNIGVRLIVSALVGAFTSYMLNKASLHGVDFEALGVSSELIKSSLIGTITGLVAAPRNIVFALRDGILFIRFAGTTIWQAIRYGSADQPQP